MMGIKTKNRNCLGAPEHDFRSTVSGVAPRIDQLMEQKLFQTSHCNPPYCCLLLVHAGSIKFVVLELNFSKFIGKVMINN